MGFWGSSLYANDTTCDVHDSYIGYLEQGISNEEAYEKVLDEFQEYMGDEEEPLFWYALAETQWKLGRLRPEVKEKALEWIENDGGMSLWEESANKGAGWKKTILKLQEKLLSPMKPEKKIRKKEEVCGDLWNLNDVYAYQFHGRFSAGTEYEGKYILLQKIGEGRIFGEDTMRIQIFDKIFEELPTLDDMDGLRILPTDIPSRVCIGEGPMCMGALIGLYKKRNYPNKYLTYLGNKPGPENNEEEHREISWECLDDSLISFHEWWKDLEYETLENGFYHFDGIKED